ncbi:hypothetical protein BC827DRAFT_1247913 [Russula dissimulans]|nr:hypothetical protein BC827DRAFT_1247913 [Russula dissimulans]
MFGFVLGPVMLGSGEDIVHFHIHLRCAGLAVPNGDVRHTLYPSKFGFWKEQTYYSRVLFKG